MRCMQWNHEPTPNPSQEGNGQDADECLLPSWEGSGVGRFMESLLSLWRMHWDHEPWKAPASRTHSKRFAKSQALGHCAAAFGVRGACSRLRTRFMESLHGLMTAHWDHEPTPNPSQEGNFRAADECLLPSWEGSGVGRFMESLIIYFATQCGHERRLRWSEADGGFISKLEDKRADRESQTRSKH